MGLQTACSMLVSPYPKQLLAFTHWPIFSQFARKTKTQEEWSFYKFHENQEPAKGEQLWGLWEKLQHKSKSHEAREKAHFPGHPAAGKHSNTARILILQGTQLHNTGTQATSLPPPMKHGSFFPFLPSNYPETKTLLKLWHTEERPSWVRVHWGTGQKDPLLPLQGCLVDLLTHTHTFADK